MTPLFNVKIPAKTFLIGEYAVLAGGPALVICSEPAFEFSLFPRGTLPEAELAEFHPQSPAGLLMSSYPDPFLDCEIRFFDPYAGKGGMGASSAQWIGCFFWLQESGVFPAGWASAEIRQAFLQQHCHEKRPPSGVDVFAQTQDGIVAYSAKKNMVPRAWEFESCFFAIFRCGIKVATHEHLRTLSASDYSHLARLSEEAVNLFSLEANLPNWKKLISTVNLYQNELVRLGLQCEETQLLIQEVLASNSNVLAIKGNGALGADTLLVIADNENRDSILQTFAARGLELLATNADLFQRTAEEI